MPIVTIQSPSGESFQIEAPEGATDEQILEFAQSQGLMNEKPATKQSFGDKALGTLENVSSMASGIIAEPIAGIAGIVQAANPFADEGAGARAVESVRGFARDLSAPRTESGKSQQKAMGEALAPIGEAISATEEFLGDSTLEATEGTILESAGPLLATIAHTLPTATLEILGFKGSKALKSGKGVSNRSVKKALVESAPDAEKLKGLARGLYSEIDQSGAVLKKESLRTLANKISAATRKQGMDPRTTKISSGVVDSIRDSALKNQPIGELDTLRNVAKGAAKSTDPTEKMLGTLIINNIEDFMDNVKSTDMVAGSESLSSTAKKYRAARSLYGRAKRSELINESIKLGGEAASGAENGIRNELRKITRSKKQSKFFPKHELDAMKNVVKGDFKTNFAKMLGRMGFMEGSSTSVLGSLGGVYAGSHFLGPVGAVAAPAIGVTARQIAKKLTTNKAKFIDTITRSGKDGKRIARAYLEAVPRGKRSLDDLSDLLADPIVNIDELEGISSQIAKDALEIAKGKRAIFLAAGAATGAAAEQLRGEDNAQ
tara:strand:+ start:1690 stop:3330 length:1641 start_codon:yes stop_codon:yes gene_type:complete